MRLVRYQAAWAVGGTGIGAVRPDGSVVTTPWPDFGALFAGPDPLRAAQALDLSRQETVALQRLLAPAVDRAQVIGTGGNYADHAAEARPGPPPMITVWIPAVPPNRSPLMPAKSASLRPAVPR
jgi:2-keto-4-pentenoate hydratase/2-oxohepta-3-ene-1,7-dioic acid hydratase in catechol pathway